MNIRALEYELLRPVDNNPILDYVGIENILEILTLDDKVLIECPLSDPDISYGKASFGSATSTAIVSGTAHKWRIRSSRGINLIRGKVGPGKNELTLSKYSIMVGDTCNFTIVDVTIDG